ncbi:uncharacterized protein SPPG_02461 [Spizellomyces punctatus DAOM BR117]|uniref:Zinc finger HIT domain-containing protein 3 n=1 Tax=Spizellomyces punctatus (strain DAOM BR117) TaxID=645134 RepID=A0A0L0HLL8_SPIPD|nr:uncharacterized protein SPPG_02461 [Spizellomyces punctatus DAOM BR117]KND01953.1 hypothetical protein SPPG_02461 [Spizellomyces punctatus DAOM BR117]|eukprot:XP_016609992.1 hypothetical protein SPPG_02461 [Spizellomyces punctatus DAOM BR117]
MSVIHGKAACQVCKEQAAKYKCSTCILPYCSLACYKKHKETPCSPPISEESPKEKPVSAPLKDMDEEGSLLTDEQLGRLGASKDISDILSNVDLQKILKELDSAQDPEKALDQAMEQIPIFREFAEKAIETVAGPRTPE